MKIVSGKLTKFLKDKAGLVAGILLDRGQEIRFWATSANVLAITEAVAIGSRVEIQGDLRIKETGREYLQAALVTNLDSKRTVSMLAPVHLGKPRMSFEAPQSGGHLWPTVKSLGAGEIPLASLPGDPGRGPNQKI